MARSLLKSRILEALGSTTLLASVVIPAACGGSTQDGKGGTSSGGTSSGGSSALGGTSGGTSEGGASGMGGGPTGGAGGVLAENCFNSGVGVCCTNPSCMSPEKAWQIVADAGVGSDAGSDGGDGGSVCPDAASMPSGLCYWYGGGTFENGACCYQYTSGSCCGRPFVIGGVARLAGVCGRGDWLGSTQAACAELDPRTLEALANEWLEDARLEHASIASFARFVLELLALGAPAELVELAQRGLGDEIDHAERCFSLASRYAGKALGPAALDVRGATDPINLAQAAARAVHEGCIGETLAARQAEEQLEWARDPFVRSTLEVIVRDEAAHAELAWRFVRWAIASGGEPVRAAVRAAFDVALRRVGNAEPEEGARVDRAAMLAHGRLSPEARLACHRAAAGEIIAPCARVLLELAAPRGDAARSRGAGEDRRSVS
jgi:hypothetical protein